MRIRGRSPFLAILDGEPQPLYLLIMSNFYRFVFPATAMMKEMTMFVRDEYGKTKEEWALERYNQFRKTRCLKPHTELPSNAKITIANIV